MAQVFSLLRLIALLLGLTLWALLLAGWWLARRPPHTLTADFGWVGEWFWEGFLFHAVVVYFFLVVAWEVRRGAR